MELRIGQLSATCFVSGQISVTDVAELAAQGFRSIVNNRPDGEDWDQPTSAEIETAAAEHGLAYIHLPVYSAGVSPQGVRALQEALSSLQAPVLLYCRSGARSAMLWQLADAG